MQIEKLTATNADAKAKWISRQLELDDIDMESGFTGKKETDSEIDEN